MGAEGASASTSCGSSLAVASFTFGAVLSALVARRRNGKPAQYEPIGGAVVVDEPADDTGVKMTTMAV